MAQLIGVYGAGGCGRGLLPLLRGQHPGADLVFIDDAKAGGMANGHDILDWHSFRARGATAKAVCLAIAAGRIRERLAQVCDAAALPLIEARHSSVVQMDAVALGAGACLSPFVTLTSNIRIGRAFHANIGAHVEHDCVIGDFVTFAPGVACNGQVTIGDRAFLGAGATIRQGLTIGADAVIGMGAVVLTDVAPGTTVAGNPARPLARP